MIKQFLSELGAYRRQDYYILDQLDPEYYLLFDCNEGGIPNTCDIFVCKPGISPSEYNKRICLISNANEQKVKDFLSVIRNS